MLLRTVRTCLLWAVAGFSVSHAMAFDGGMGAGCGGGIGSSFGSSSYTNGSFGCTGYGGGYTGWTNGGGASGFGSASYLGRGYRGSGLTYAREKSLPTVSSLAGKPATAQGVLLKVSLPADAKLFINDLPTTSTGQVRRFSSMQFPPSTVFRYRVRAEFVSDGVARIDERMVRLSDGQSASVDFLRIMPTATSNAATDRPSMPAEGVTAFTTEGATGHFSRLSGLRNQTEHVKIE